MKKFYLGALGCLMAMGVGAQTFDQVGTLQQWDSESFFSIPKAFAVDGKSSPFSVGETEDGSLQINVYNKSFAVERTITMDAPTNYRRVEVEKREAVVNSTERTVDCIEHTGDYGDKGYRTYFVEYCCESATYTDEYVYEWVGYMREENQGSGTWWEHASIIEKREVDGGSLFVTGVYPDYGELYGLYFKDNQLSNYYSYNNEVQIQVGYYNEEYYSFYNMVNCEFSQEYITEYINHVGANGYDFLDRWYTGRSYQVDSVFTTPNGETHFYTNQRTEIDGESYPTCYFVWQDESITVHYAKYTTTYTGEWVKETKEYNYFDEYDCCIYPWAIGQCAELDDAYILATQTLFNNDATWEFVRPVYKEVVDDDSWETREEDRDGDGEIDYKSTSYNNQETGYEIVSENGDVLTTITVEENDYCSPRVIQWDDEVFFGVYISNRIYSEDDDGTPDYVSEQYMVVYSIDKNTTNIKKVAATPAMRVSPALAERNSTVNVTLDAETAKNGGELIITDSNGRAIGRRRVEVGQTSVPVTTDRMTSGVYNITLTEKGQKVENARIIVK